MRLKRKKAVGCGLAAASFVMLSAFNSEASVLPQDAGTDSSSVSEIVGEIGINIQDLVEAVEISRKEAALADYYWNGRAMADIEESLNVRSQADADSEIVGVIYLGGAVDIIEEGEEWSLVTSGDVEGYVKTDYLAFDEDAEALAEQYGRKIATVTTEGLRVRKGPGTDESIIGFLNEGNELEVQDELEEWIKVVYEDGEYYIAAEHAEVEWDLDNAKTAEQIEQERQEEERRQEEEARKEREAQEAAAAASSSSSSAGQGGSSASVSADTSDLQLLAAIIECEAGGESYEGKIAVGAVVLNRVRSGSFPGTISGVIYQSGQFGPASSGKLANVLSRGANSSCVQAAQDALNGSNNVGGALYFKNASAGQGITIGNHCFY